MISLRAAALVMVCLSACAGTAPPPKQVEASAARAEQGAAPKPIVAVFDVEAQGVTIAHDTLERLSGYLTVVTIEAGAYRVIPREQVRARLRNEKKKSFKSCYDQRCQIEIGRELAAAKVLATRVVRLGSGCTVTATLYDLKSATAESGARQRGRCTESAVAEMLSQVAAKISGQDAAPDAEPSAGGTSAGGATAQRQGRRTIRLDDCEDCVIDVDRESDKEARRRREAELRRARYKRYRRGR